MGNDYYTKIMNETYETRYYLNGELHRLSGPAIDRYDGGKEWYQEGKRHRLFGPAIERSDGGTEWWQNGVRHRELAPALKLPTGHKEWWVQGKRHRLGGPAVERADGTKEWYKEGKFHRLDGPAIETSFGINTYVIDGVILTEKEFMNIIKPVKDMRQGSRFNPFTVVPHREHHLCAYSDRAYRDGRVRKAMLNGIQHQV